MSTAVAKGQADAPRFVTDEARWDAVVRRDPAADALFYYSVKTTGVYCRPSCGARLARRENIAFHATCADAEKAGFRACKRCRPGQAGLSERRVSAVVQACRLIDASEEMPDLDTLAAAAGMSRFHFHRVFKATTGVTPRAYAGARRGERMRKELSGGLTVTDAVYAAGFNSSGRFYATSSSLLGMTPTEFRRGGSGASVRFAAGECTLGSILVAASDKGVCAILLGDDPDALARELQDLFPNAALAAGDSEFEAWVAKVVGFVDAPQIGLDLPLDVGGTAFQQRVWRALREIPAGSTVSYAALAAAIGAPGAARAVARACAANSLAVAIPCHRVVRTDGAVSGYRWGVERKRALLDRERQGGSAAR
jgi:AraC family transcriptional regulator of adaptative response/methylated-DNA-[protein]-cysteine methyltransferase